MSIKNSKNLLMMKIMEYDFNNDLKYIKERIGIDDFFFKDKHFLITGGTGFFGKWIILYLLYLNKYFFLNIKITVITRSKKNFLDQSNLFRCNDLYFIESDIRNVKLNSSFDYLIHMATTNAQETFLGEDQINKVDLLYQGTKNILENAIKCKVKRILFTSSGTVYGPIKCKDDSIESFGKSVDTSTFNSGLAQGKRIAEYLVNYYSKKNSIPFSIARCFSFIGPFLPSDIHYAAGNFIRDAIIRDDIVISGDGSPVRSYLDVRDLVIWLLKLLNFDENLVVNVGSSEDISIYSLACKIRDIISPKKNIILEGSRNEINNLAINYYVPNIDLITSKLNVKQTINLDQSIINYAKFFKASRDFNSNI